MSLKKLFVQGPISPEYILKSIVSHQDKGEIGAHSIFLGQVRADEIDSRKVVAIEYESYSDMADEIYTQLREEVFLKYDLECLHVYHSLGRVEVGQVCFFVFASSPRRKAAMEACQFMVEEVKSRIPIFGKELFLEGNYIWKENAVGR